MTEVKNLPKSAPTKMTGIKKSAPVKMTSMPKSASIKVMGIPKANEANEAREATFAIFATGGKQYNVKVGDKVKIEKLSDIHKEGDKLTFDKVLLIDGGTSDIKLGTPFIAGATVTATLNKIARYKTVDVIKYKQKSRYFKKYGHRQPYFEIKIDSIK